MHLFHLFGMFVKIPSLNPEMFKTKLAVSGNQCMLPVDDVWETDSWEGGNYEVIHHFCGCFKPTSSCSAENT